MKKTFGQLVRERREKKGLGQADLASLVIIDGEAISDSTISMIERGWVPSIETGSAIARALVGKSEVYGDLIEAFHAAHRRQKKLKRQVKYPEFGQALDALLTKLTELQKLRARGGEEPLELISTTVAPMIGKHPVSVQNWRNGEELPSKETFDLLEAKLIELGATVEDCLELEAAHKLGVMNRVAVLSEPYKFSKTSIKSLLARAMQSAAPAQ